MKAEITSENNFPTTLQGAIKFFADEDVAFEFMKGIRWPDGKIACPRCGSEQHSFISTRKLWTCKNCKTKKQFTIKVGTVMEDSPIGYDKWICGFWLIANAKNGISSYEVGRALGVTQRTGWFLLHRIRTAMQIGSIVKDKLNGTVEVDESYIGGKARNMHAHVKREKVKGTGNKALTPVQGLLQRTTKERASRVVMQVVDGTKRPELRPQVCAQGNGSPHGRPALLHGSCGRLQSQGRGSR
jgi:transposase-like protein